jgi:hypothetical protein
MRLLLWIALLGALAVVGAMFLPLVAGLLLLACCESHPAARRRPRASRLDRTPVEPVAG